MFVPMCIDANDYNQAIQFFKKKSQNPFKKKISADNYWLLQFEK